MYNCKESDWKLYRKLIAGWQEKYIERLCQYIFGNSMEKFTNEETPDFIQMYFEEAHNIFPKDDKDLKNIYNRLAKESAKLKIGISYSTQEVSSIAPSILKNTQNWFVSHLNTKDEIKTVAVEIKNMFD